MKSLCRDTIAYYEVIFGRGEEEEDATEIMRVFAENKN